MVRPITNNFVISNCSLRESIFKNIKSPSKTWLKFLKKNSRCWVWSWQWNKEKTENWNVKFNQKKKKITKSNLSWCHKSVPNSCNEKVQIFQRLFFLLISFLACHGKLVPLHNMVYIELFYLLEICRYEQNKGAERP